MAQEKNLAVRKASGALVQARSVAALGRGMALVKIGKPSKPPVRPGDETTAMVRKAALALNKPGISASAIFRGPRPEKIFSYSVFPRDPSKVVRVASDGTQTIGRLVSGKFRAIKE